MAGDPPTNENIYPEERERLEGREMFKGQRNQRGLNFDFGFLNRFEYIFVFLCIIMGKQNCINSSAPKCGTFLLTIWTKILIFSKH